MIRTHKLRQFVRRVPSLVLVSVKENEFKMEIEIGLVTRGVGENGATRSVKCVQRVSGREDGGCDV